MSRVVAVGLGRVTCLSLERALEGSGAGLEVCADGAALLGCLDDGPKPDAVLFPPHLPDLGPEAVAAALADRHGGTKAVLVGTLEAHGELAARLPGVRCLGVPFSAGAVRMLLGRPADRTRKVVLLTDDSLVIHRHTVPILREAGYDVVSAHDGRQGLEMARELLPDAVVTDVDMPLMSGFELCHALKTDERTARAPVLICSARADAADLQAGFDAGADDYLVKPVVPEELTTRLKLLLPDEMESQRERILVVDDAAVTRRYVSDCLRRQGFEVDTAENGRVGLEKARAWRPALVVSDYEMPEMDGFEMVHRLKRSRETRNIAVIMITARDSERDVKQMHAAGAAAYLVKPFTSDKCVATVEHTLASKRLHDYKEASKLFISDGARQAAEERALAGDVGRVRAEELEMSILFSDICGFTSLSARMEPREVIELLNEYFDVLCPLVKSEGGDIDKFIGDAIMALFPPREGHDPPAVRATRAALAMQESMATFNANRETSIRMRIGINTGSLVRGDLGSKYHRRDFTVIGDTVNRANRFESAAPPGGVLVSESTFALLPPGGDAVRLDDLRLKGLEGTSSGWVVRAVGQGERGGP